MHDAGFMTPETVYVHAPSLSTDSYHRIAATGGSVSVSTESEQSAGQGYPPTWQVRKHGIRSRCRWTPASGGRPTCSRPCAPPWAPTAPASTSRPTSRATPSPRCTCGPSTSSTGHPGGAKAIGRDDLGSLEPGKTADVVLIKNDASPVSFPLLNPYGHVAFQAQRGDVHTCWSAAGS